MARENRRRDYHRRWYWEHAAERRKDAREGKARRRWGAWLLREVRVDLSQPLQLSLPLEPPVGPLPTWARGRLALPGRRTHRQQRPTRSGEAIDLAWFMPIWS
jgi:hypothetical protein